MARRGKTITKKDQILALHAAGARGVGELAGLTGTRPSYVAHVLRGAEDGQGYFDLYTTTEQQMNVYSRLFAKRLGFRTEGIARRSVTYINQLYRRFAQLGDRAGQHHALVMALTMFNRARWSGKAAEGEIFRRWVQQQLTEAEEIVPAQSTTTRPTTRRSKAHAHRAARVAAHAR